MGVDGDRRESTPNPQIRSWDAESLATVCRTRGGGRSSNRRTPTSSSTARRGARCRAKQSHGPRRVRIVGRMRMQPRDDRSSGVHLCVCGVERGPWGKSGPRCSWVDPTPWGGAASAPRVYGRVCSDKSSPGHTRGCEATDPLLPSLRRFPRRAAPMLPGSRMTALSSVK